MEHVLSALDAQGRSTTKRFSGLAATVAAGQTDMADLITDLLAVSDLGTSKYSTAVDTVAVNAVGNAAANKDEAVNVRLQMTDGSIENFRIPAPAKNASGVFEYVSGGAVDIANANIVAFFANFLAGGQFRINGKVVQSILSGTLED